MCFALPAPRDLLNKKVWSTSFIWIEALVSPRTNKRDSTPIMAICHGRAQGTTQGDGSDRFIPVLVKFTRFLSKDKSENTFISM